MNLLACELVTTSRMSLNISSIIRVFLITKHSPSSRRRRRRLHQRLAAVWHYFLTIVLFLVSGLASDRSASPLSATLTDSEVSVHVCAWPCVHACVWNQYELTRSAFTCLCIHYLFTVRRPPRWRFLFAKAAHWCPISMWGRQSRMKGNGVGSESSNNMTAYIFIKPPKRWSCSNCLLHVFNLFSLPASVIDVY